ncbi:DUF502 domain-containing protein [Stratiformator vulcanicus]|uniref:DUF502 domain-containing protein n=1 Tax=Stratiformator vulcanicus TaxID=2527980 RepID=A0A517R299_9PLAN|nr:DUF502 domain-containing protein [Stratiformator vulcanicus]QDT37984.1 hypothetical protein Pan189_23680 [Stratiformator vulcanicus]
MANSNDEQPEQQTSKSIGSSGVGWLVRTLMGGAAFILPIVVLLAIFQYIYFLINSYFIDPLLKLVLPKSAEDTALAYWAPLLSIVAAVAFLFLMGLLARLRLQKLMNWFFEKIPGISTLYTAIRDTVHAMTGRPGLADVDTVVLVPFPQPETRMAGYLMTKSKQPDGSSLVAVYVPLVLFPPSGYTLILPEEKIVYTDWPTKDVWKLLMSGGLTLPPTIPYQPEDGTSKTYETSGRPAVDHQDDGST